ncbi:PIN domain nuclease [Sphingomonas sp.]|uniref:type II toxin-antitoxin system VapC family toxin n=1 Tax=Sphingomonas sp. TaxID=28214 RepID=UPI003AFFA9BD
MILVDSSVWIDLLLDRQTVAVRAVQTLLDQGKPLAIGDLILMEVLQGAREQRQFRAASEFLARFVPVTISDHRVAVAAARNYRLLRSLGVTIRKTIDTLIATRCILDDIPLLFADRDFHPFVEHLNLRSAIDDTGVN